MFGKGLVIVVILLALALSLRLFLYHSSLHPFVDGEKLSFRFILLTEPRVEGKFQKFVVTPKGREKVFVTAPLFPRLSYGEEVHITGVVKRHQIVPKNGENVSSEDNSLLRGENVINTMFFPQIEAKPVAYLLPLATLRKNLITIFSSYLSPASESLLLGIVFGIRSTMPKDLAENLRTGGVIHITAASGMNVTMVAGAIFFLLSGFLRRQVAIVVGFLFVWLYALLAGFEPSILRASVMSSFAFAAGLVGRQNTSILALLLTASVMLFISPQLVSDVGFLLSCFATLGIILMGHVFRGGQYLVDPLSQKKQESFVTAFKQDVLTTTSAQIGTLPILFLYFGQYNILSILINALILWTIPFLMIFGAVAALLGLLFRPLAAVVLYLSLPLLTYIEVLTAFFAKYPVYVKTQDVSILFVIGYYCLFFSFYGFFRFKRL